MQQTDIKKLVVAFRNFANALKNWCDAMLPSRKLTTFFRNVGKCIVECENATSQKLGFTIAKTLPQIKI